MSAPDGPHEKLWRARYGVGSPAFLTRRTGPPLPPPPPKSSTPSPTGWLSSAGRAWRRLSRKAQWFLMLVIFFAMQSATPPAGVVFVVVWFAFIVATHPDEEPEPEPATAEVVPRVSHKETVLASTMSLEAQVAGAASQAWEETKAEPSWSSPLLAMIRESFDGHREVDTIVDVAARINHARSTLGAQPAGPAARIWQQQADALDQAALRLGDRADALIRHRDQAAALSGELAQLDALERLERSSVLVEDLAIETSIAATSAHGQLPVSDQIAATRAAVTDLIELMTRTLAPLDTPPGQQDIGTLLGGR